jgi:multidrug efflux pump subunit AcrA (membrane-fusion protein)
MLRVAIIVLMIGVAEFTQHQVMISPAVAQTTAPVAARGIVDTEGGVAKIASPRDGIVQEILVDEGAGVKKGDVLLVVDDRAARVQRDVAEAELRQAETAVG